MIKENWTSVSRIEPSACLNASSPAGVAFCRRTLHSSGNLQASASCDQGWQTELRTEEIKATQRGSLPKICPVGGGEGAKRGAYQEDMNEAAQLITKAMCEKRGAS